MKFVFLIGWAIAWTSCAFGTVVSVVSDEECPDEIAGGLIGRSARLNEVRAQIAAVAPRKTVVHLSGETGAGKGAIARAIHEASGRRGPFLAVNVAALPESLIERELFGHVRGAFTGATEASDGFFGSAAEGTIFLDEIGRLSPTLQSRLLQVCDDGTYYPVGSTRAKQSQARIIVASSLDLRTEMAEGRFLPDLYYRLSVFEINAPALREHAEDLAAITAHLIGRLGETPEERSKFFTPEAAAQLRNYPWPGNVRELRNVVERAIIASGDRPAMQIRDLPPSVSQYGVIPIGETPGAVPLTVARNPLDILVTDLDMEARLIEKEIELFREALSAHDRNYTHAARALGLSVTTLQRRMTEIGMNGQGQVIGDPFVRRESDGTNRRFVEPKPEAGPLDYHTAMWNLMRTSILTALDRAHGVKQEAARLLRMNGSTLNRRILQLRIEWPRPAGEG